MFTRNIRSGTEEHPAPRDVFDALLVRLTEGKHRDGWVHLEWREHSGWLRNLFRGTPAFVEVALRQDNMLELNFGLPSEVKDPEEHGKSKGVPFPDGWTILDGTCRIPVSDIHSLTEWVEPYFVKVHGCPPDFEVDGYLDGI